MSFLLQVRGANASGKSTAVREYVERCESRRETILGTPVTVSEGPEGRVVAIGTYVNRKFGGVDSLSLTNEGIFDLVDAISATYAPRCIIFDSYLRSDLYKFSLALAEHLRRAGLGYRNLFLYAPLDVAKRRIEGRKGKPANEDRLIDRMRRVDRCFVKLRRAGIAAERVSTGDIPLERMGDLIEDAIRAHG